MNIRDPELRVDDVMLEVQAEVARIKAGGLFPRAARLAGTQERDATHTLWGLLDADGDEFVRQAYQVLLRRDPDSEANEYLVDLRTGRRSKIDVLRAIRFSEEGRRANVPILGLHDPALEAVDGKGEFALPGARIAEKAAYDISEFLAYHDEDFVTNAYRGILRREADPAAYAAFLPRLRSGDLDRVRVLGAVRYSPEGTRAAVQIHGLRSRYLLNRAERLPVLGQIVSAIITAARLRRVAQHHERLEAAVYRDRVASRDMQRRCAALQCELEALTAFAGSSRKLMLLNERIGHALAVLDSVSRRQDMLEGRQAGSASSALVHELASEVRLVRDRVHPDALMKVAQGVLDAPLSAMQAQVGATEIALAHLRDRLTELSHGWRSAGNQEQQFAQSRSTGQVGSLQPEQTITGELDAFYASFEDRFRGAAEEIKPRLAVYVPIVREAGAGTAEMPILDIGCGRGEWLELLRDQGLVARGIDQNEVMVERCRAHGLDVVAGDAVSYLRKTPAASLGAVTAMHVIEHLPFRELLDFFDQTMRVLHRGGVAIFETPNPENLIVGACSFYLDPTHQRPLPPESTKYLMESRGFARVQLMRLNPYPAEMHIQTGEPQMRERLNAMLYGPQDYALVAHKD